MFIENQNPNWKEGKLSDLVAVKYGKDHKKLDGGCYPVYGSGGIMRYVAKPLYTGESVLIPRKGTLNNVMYVNGAFWSVDTMFYTEMLRPNIAKFVYHFVKGKDLASSNAGSAVPSMTTNILNAMPLYVPDDKTLSIFEETLTPMYSQMQENEKQSANLANIRDTLLPRLMSGELEVSDIDLYAADRLENCFAVSSLPPLPDTLPSVCKHPFAKMSVYAAIAAIRALHG